MQTANASKSLPSPALTCAHLEESKQSVASSTMKTTRYKIIAALLRPVTLAGHCPKFFT